MALSLTDPGLDYYEAICDTKEEALVARARQMAMRMAKNG